MFIVFVCGIKIIIHNRKIYWLQLENSYNDNSSDNKKHFSSQVLSSVCVLMWRMRLLSCTAGVFGICVPSAPVDTLQMLDQSHQAELKGQAVSHYIRHHTLTHTHKSQPNLCFQGDTGLAGRRGAVVNSGDRVLQR